jgi:hypothetical protein
VSVLLVKESLLEFEVGSMGNLPNAPVSGGISSFHWKSK